MCGHFGGFSVDDPAWMYLMERKDNPGEQQIGITNDINERIKTHKQKNWKLLDKTKNFYLGQEVLDIETKIKRWLKLEIGLVKGRKENWYMSNLKVKTLAEIQKKCGIENPLY